MRTIAVTLEDSTLEALDRVTHGPGRKRRGRSPSRSEVVRRALREYLERHEKAAREEKERAIFAANRELLAREAAALAAEQAEP